MDCNMIHGDWEKQFDSFNDEHSATTTFPSSATTTVPPSPPPARPSPSRDRSSSLSPAPETGSLADSPRKDDDDDDPPRLAPSRLSTPLSDLSPPPPDHDDEPEPPPKQQQPKLDQPKHEPPKLESTPSIESPRTPWSVPSLSSDPKVVSILDLNLELLKCVLCFHCERPLIFFPCRVCMEFQSRGISLGEPLFSQ